MKTKKSLREGALPSKQQAFLLKLADRKGGELQFDTIGGFRCEETITPQEPDDQDSNIIVKANGVFVSDHFESLTKTFAREESLQELELSWEAGKRQRGSFIIEMEYAGQFNDTRSFNITLKGVGKCYELVE